MFGDTAFAEGEKMRLAYREGGQEQDTILLCKETVEDKKWDQGRGQKEEGRAEDHIKAEERQIYTQQCQKKHRDNCVEQ